MQSYEKIEEEDEDADGYTLYAVTILDFNSLRELRISFFGICATSIAILEQAHRTLVIG